MKTGQNPSVSVVIPVFNGVQYIQDAITSVLSQTFKDFEIIIIDDGSTDETRTALEPLVKQGVINYVYQTNKGAAAARNAGIRLAKGKYLKFLDADDTIYPQQLELQTHHLENKPDNFISVTDFQFEFTSKVKKDIVVWLGNGNQLARFIKGNIGPIHGCLVYRSLVERIGRFDEELSSCQDTDFWLRAVINGGVFERIDYIGCCYRILGNSVSSNPDKQFRQRCKVFEKLNKILSVKFNQLPNEVIQQLLESNTRLIHMCFARNIKPTSCLSITLKSSQSIYEMKVDGLRKFLLKIIGIQSVILLKYIKSCLWDQKYYAGLMNNTAWRDENSYA